MESIHVYELITTPYLEERPHFQWHESPEAAMRDFQNWAEAVYADGKVQEVTYEIVPHDLTTMEELLDALNNVSPDVIDSAAKAAEYWASMGKPSKNATRVRLDGETA